MHVQPRARSPQACQHGFKALRLAAWVGAELERCQRSTQLLVLLLACQAGDEALQLLQTKLAA